MEEKKKKKQGNVIGANTKVEFNIYIYKAIYTYKVFYLSQLNQNWNGFFPFLYALNKINSRFCREERKLVQKGAPSTAPTGGENRVEAFLVISHVTDRQLGVRRSFDTLFFKIQTVP